MNYVGSISILDRGDAPAQAVIDRNARSLAQRIADDTKDELEKVMTRVETIYSTFEDTEQVYGTSNLEYLQDVAELEELMKDQVKKKKYQQQVTIFIVGFSDVSGQKLRLMQQVNEFFTENSKNIDEEEWFPTTPDLDLEEVGDKIEDSLQVARELTQHLGDLNKEMVEYMASYAEKKATTKGKKKVERALQQARDEVQALAEKLQSAQTDVEEKEEKLQATFKQLELKNLEVQKFRTAAELAKKAVQDTEELQEAIEERDARLREQRQKLTRLEIDLAQSNHLKERNQNKLSNMGEELQQKITSLTKELEEQKQVADDAKRDLSKFHDDQLTKLREVHQQDMDEMKKQHAEQIKSLSTDLQRARTELATTQHSLLELQLEKGISDTQSEVGRQFDLESSEDGTSRQSSKQKAPMVIAVRQKRARIKHKESRPSTKGRGAGVKKTGAKSGGKDSKGGRNGNKEFSEAGMQDEGGDPSTALFEDNKNKPPGTRHSRRSRSTLAPVEEFEDYDEVYDLTDEQAWASVPKDQLEGRFAQYRRICQHKLRETDEQRQLTVAKTQRKVQLLKAQFVEHKTKWETERKVLISQVEQAQQLQTDAEKEADQAMTQLEDFIAEQERLEEEEEVRRSAILRGTSIASLSPGAQSPGARTPLPSTPAAAGTVSSAQGTRLESRNTQSSEELNKLMQQTDDAKSQRQESKQASPTPSLTPGAMGALLDVSQVPVHKRQPSPTPSPVEVSQAPSRSSPKAQTSPVIVEASSEASEKAVAEALEAAAEKMAKESVVEVSKEAVQQVASVAEVVETVDDQVVELAAEQVVEPATEEARVASAKVQEAIAEGTSSPAAPVTQQSAIEGSEAATIQDIPSRGSPESTSDIPADLPIIMLMGGNFTPAAVLAGSSRLASSGQGSRSVPGSRQSRRVLIMQPKSVPGSALRARTAAGTAPTEGSSTLSSASMFVPMALDVAALMNPKADSPLSPTPTLSQPASASLPREATMSVTGAQREATFVSAISAQREVTFSSVSILKEGDESRADKSPTPVAAPSQQGRVTSAAGEESRADKSPTPVVAPSQQGQSSSAAGEESVTEKSATPVVAANEERPVTSKEASEVSAAKEEEAPSVGKEDADMEKKGEEDEKPMMSQGVEVKQDVTQTESTATATQQAEELKGRLTGTKSAPPGVDTAAITPDNGQEQTTTDTAQSGMERAKTAGNFPGASMVPVMRGAQLLQLAAMDSITGMTIPVVYGEGKQMALFDLTPGTVTPYPIVSDQDAPALQCVLTTTFLTRDGNLVVTDPMSLAEGAKQGLIAVEVQATPTAPSSAMSREVSAVRPGGSAGILRSSRPSPATSPTRQVSFALRDSVTSSSPHEGAMSPRLSRLRRSRTAEGMPSDLSVVMETTLPAAQESALDSMRKMLMEENLPPQQQQTLDSMRSAMSRIKSYSSKAEDRGLPDGSSRLTNDELLRTMTVLTLASQLTHEAIKLGVRPNSIFRNFSRLDTHILSEIAPRASRKGHRPEGVSRETTTADLLPSSTDDTELAEGASQEAVQQVGLEELKDLPPIDGTSADEMSTPSIQPPPTAATIGSLPSHDQLETPLAEIANGGAAGLAKGDKEASELKEDVSNLEKSRTNVTEDRQATQVSETGEGKEGGTGFEGISEDHAAAPADSNENGSKMAQPPSKTPEAIVKIQGDTEHDLREASARSRASLRSVYKNRLEESRAAAEDRRTKSPHIALPSSLSVDDELVLDDDDEDFDEEMALPDDLKEELEEQRKRELSRGDTGTSPPPGPGKEHYYARKSMSLVDHPLLKEYLKTYDCVTGFKDSLGKVLLDKDMMSASQIVSDLEILAFDKDKKVMPQVEMLTNNVIYILEEISSVINHAVMVDREPPVSSLFPFSRDEMRSRLPPTREASEDMYPAYSHPKMVTPATGFTGQVLFAAGSDERKEAPLPVVDGIGLDGTDAVTAAILGGPMQAARRDSAGDGGSGGVGGDVGLDMGRMEGQLPEAGSQAGSLQGSRKSSVSGSTKQHLAELQAQCSVLQCQLEDESKKHEEQLRHNTVVMMEMQDTINELQRELSAIGKATNKPRSAASSAMGLAKAPSPDQSLLFTRLDLERNAKTMKKAVMDQRLSPDKYKEAVTTMDDYVSLPAQRLAHLVKKYVHHSRMKEIEENVKNSESLDEGVFDALDKMEALQNQRARQWAEKMDSMGLERLRLAAMLMDSLDSIEQESGLFLIKPMYSYRGRELKAPPTQKLARPVRSQPVPRHQSAAVESTTSFVPAPTPASNMRRMDRQTPTHQVPVDLNALPPPPPSRPEDGVVGAGAIRNIVTPQMPQVAQSYQTWNMSASQARSPYENLQHPLNTPRMLELDINRMLIGQNNVSTKLPHPPSDDRLVNASNNSLRSYVTVQRPTATLAAERPLSASGGRDTAAPPSSPRPLVPVSPADRDLPQSMTSPPPLPPIADRSGSAASSHHDDPEPPRSPPGSSMYQSTTQDLEEGNLAKEMTRTSSQFSNLSMSDGQQE